MDSLFFLAGGAFFVFFGAYMRKGHNEFLSACTRVQGLVTGIREIRHRDRNQHAPVVEFRYNGLMRFVAEVDVRQERLAEGDMVSVLVRKDNPKIAKLETGSGQMKIIISIFIVLGLIGIAVGIFTFDPSHFSLSIFQDPLIPGLSLAVLLFFGIKILPIIKHLKTSPIYHENAEQLEE